MLLFLLLAGAGLGWLWWGWQAEQPAIAQLRDLHAGFSARPVVPEWLGRVLGNRFGYLADRVQAVSLDAQLEAPLEKLDFNCLRHLKVLSLMDCELSDSALLKVCDATNLEDLYLESRTGKMPGLARLAALPRLTILDLLGHWDDSSIEDISALKQLRELSLASSQISDCGLDHLQGMSSLQELHLETLPITDAGLERLQGMKSLRIIWLSGSAVSSAGVAKLKQAIPGLEVRE